MPTKKKDPMSSSSLFEEVRFPMQPFRSHGAPQCSVVKIDYLRKDDPDGKCRLVANGKVNIYQQIQSYRADTEYSVLLEKMEAGDPWATAQYEQMLMQHGYDVQDGIQDGVFPDLRTVLDSFYLSFPKYIFVTWKKRDRASPIPLVYSPPFRHHQALFFSLGNIYCRTQYRKPYLQVS